MTNAAKTCLLSATTVLHVACRGSVINSQTHHYSSREAVHRPSCLRVAIYSEQKCAEKYNK